MSSLPEPAAYGSPSPRASALADRLEAGARALADFASSLNDRQWLTPVAGDGRPVGVVVHHVASVYPIEVELARTIASGRAVTGVATADIHAMNLGHARENAAAKKEATLALLRANSATASRAIRALSDEELDRAATVSLYHDAPLTCQFVLEDHAVRHSYHHLARIRQTLER